jgi:hypothetical protein
MKNKLLEPMEAMQQLAAKALHDGFQFQALHEYRDEHHVITYWRIRLKHENGNKWIRPMYLNLTGQYVVGEPPTLKNQLKPLYGLNLITNYSEAKIFIVEGESCADTLNAFFAQQQAFGKYLAVTSGSATSHTYANWEVLCNRHCILWPDHDEAGLQCMREIYKKLKSLHCVLEYIDIKKLNLPESGDCVDWLNINSSATLIDIEHFIFAHEKNQKKENKKQDLNSIDETILQLSTLSQVEYDRVRIEKSQALGIRATTLDNAVKSIRKESELEENNDIPFPQITPWPEPIVLEELCNDIMRLIQQLIICEPETAIATTLWIVMTWLTDSIQIAPLAVITAPEKRCGKSQLLSLLGRLVYRPLLASNITPAALFRAVDAWHPTLLIDEADTFMRDNEELRGLLNCGHTRDSAYIIRTVGDNHTPKRFFVWGAKAVAGIGYLADTLMDRAIILKLRRKLSHENITKIRYINPQVFENFTSKLARFAKDNQESVKDIKPELPHELNDRAQDNWEPLLAIAEIAGTHWAMLARQAALKLNQQEEPQQSISLELITDIQELFASKSLERIASHQLIHELCKDEEKAWATYNRGLPIKPRQVASHLKKFGIESRTIRLDAYTTAKGYLKTEFQDTFTRYLGAYGEKAVTTSQDGFFQAKCVTENNL